MGGESGVVVVYGFAAPDNRFITDLPGVHLFADGDPGCAVYGVLCPTWNDNISTSLTSILNFKKHHELLEASRILIDKMNQFARLCDTEADWIVVLRGEVAICGTNMRQYIDDNREDVSQDHHDVNQDDDQEVKYDYDTENTENTQDSEDESHIITTTVDMLSNIVKQADQIWG